MESVSDIVWRMICIRAEVKVSLLLIVEDDLHLDDNTLVLPLATYMVVALNVGSKVCRLRTEHHHTGTQTER